jgi:hypothetical protein
MTIFFTFWGIAVRDYAERRMCHSLQFVSYASAAVVVLCVEAPIAQLEKLLLK